jgi:hypothetical protein
MFFAWMRDGCRLLIGMVAAAMFYFSPGRSRTDSSPSAGLGIGRDPHGLGTIRTFGSGFHAGARFGFPLSALLIGGPIQAATGSTLMIGAGTGSRMKRKPPGAL